MILWTLEICDWKNRRCYYVWKDIDDCPKILPELKILAISRDPQLFFVSY